MARSSPAAPQTSRNLYNAFISYSHAVDGRLAPALQEALTSFAKPWYRRRALRVFRDDASLSASPGLWSSIVSALDSSEFFILLASPEAARSPWVEREVAHWLSHSGVDSMLLVLTDGEIQWDDEQQRFDPERTDALPPSARAAFAQEPRHIDLRWTQTVEHLSRRHPGFRERVADIAAPLHHRPRDDLIGEDVRQHRRAIRLARGAATTLAMLLVLAVGAAVYAMRQRDDAREQTRVALSRQLSADANAAIGGSLDTALLLARQAQRVRRTAQSRQALLAALQSNPRLDRWLWHEPQGPDAPVGATFNDDATLRAQFERGSVRVYDVKTGRALGRPARVDAKPTDETDLGTGFSPDHRLLAVSSFDTVRLVDLDSGKPAGRPLEVTRPKLPFGQSPLAQSVEFSHDGGLLAAGGYRGTALFDMRSRRRIAMLRGRAVSGGHGMSEAVRFSDDDSTLATIDDAGVALWDVGRRRLAWRVPDSDGAVDVAFTPGGRRIAVQTNFGARMWDVVQRRRVGREMPGTPNMYSADFSPDGLLLATGGRDGTLVWSAETGESAEQRLTTGASDESPDEVATVSFTSPTRLLTTGAHGVIRWRLDRGRRLATATIPAGSDANAVTFSPDGRLLATKGDGGVALWDARTGQRSGATLPGPVVHVSNLAFAPDGRTLAVGEESGAVLWDVRARRPLGKPLSGFLRGVLAVAISPDGRFLAAGEHDRTTLWDARSRRELAGLRPPTGATTALAFAPDGALLAAANDAASEKAVTLWDVQSRRRRGTLDVTSARDVAFSPDGRTLAVVASGLTLWDVEARRRLGLAFAGSESVARVEFSPDGRTIAATEAGGASLWDVQTHRRIGALTRASPPASGEPIPAVAFSPDGRRLAVVDGSDQVSLWDVDERSWMRRACAIAGRDLTREEWDDFIGSLADFTPVCGA